MDCVQTLRQTNDAFEEAEGSSCSTAVVCLDSEILLVSEACVQGTCRASHAKVMTVAPSARDVSPSATVSR